MAKKPGGLGRDFYSIIGDNDIFESKREELILATSSPEFFNNIYSLK